MAKFLGFCLFAVLFVSFGYSYVIENEVKSQGELPIDEATNTIGRLINDGSSRIAAGVDAKPGENLDFVSLTIVFQNQMQTCGGSLIHPEYVLTSASCVLDPIEGPASVVNSTFSQMKPPKVITKAALIIHDEFSFSEPHHNIALVKLSTPVVTDDKTVALGVVDVNIEPDFFVGKTMRACGMGSTANYPTIPKKLRCTDLNVSPVEECGGPPETTPAPTTPAPPRKLIARQAPPPPPNLMCTLWPDRENNICNGDYGGPLYAYSIGADKKFKQTVVAISTISPDYRPQAPCLDGHKVFHTQIAPFAEWIGIATGTITTTTTTTTTTTAAPP